MKKLIKLLVACLALCLLSAVGAHAQKQATTDTSTDNISFTTITTRADSIVAAKHHTDSVNKAASIAKTQSKAGGKASNLHKAEAPKTPWEIFIAGFVGGLLAVTMPCIYPMLPLTVSFFTKKTGSRAKAISHSALYGLSIIVIYVLLGLGITLIFGASAMNALATNGIFNFVFFLLLVLFGISFLGAFELTLPNSWANKLDQNSDRGGLQGIFFMAATLVVVSFSCTGPIIGGLLVQAATTGALLGPALGMFGFSLALALPFVVFALFPTALNSLPKSGGWLNSVKVTLGFVELAMSLKFLSNVDLAYHWNWFDREICLSLWIALGILLVLYLLGKIKFPHDSPLQHITIPRMGVTIVVTAFVIYLIPGMWGAPLKVVSALLPPPATQDFNLYNLQVSGGSAAPTLSAADLKSIGPKKYEANFERAKLPGFDSWYDYDQALQVSKITHKPVLIDFTGWNCVNCRNMENNVFTDPKIHKCIKNTYVLVELYVDDKTELQKNEQFISSYSGKKITNLGAKWSDFQAFKFDSNSQPYYVIVNSRGDVLLPPHGVDNINNYLKFLEDGIAEYQKNNGTN